MVKISYYTTTMRHQDRKYCFVMCLRLKIMKTG